MSKTMLGEIFITEKGNLVLTCNLDILRACLVTSGVEAIWDGNEGPSGDQGVGPSEEEKVDPPVTDDETGPDPNDTTGKEEKIDKNMEHVDAIDIFEPVTKQGKTLGGALEDLEGRAEINEMMAWLKDNKFNYRNFCRYLFSLDSLMGTPLSCPLIGQTQKGEPSIYKLAVRYFHWWKGNQKSVAQDYNTFLTNQLKEMDIAVETVKEVLGGEEIDPENLPKGIKLG